MKKTNLLIAIINTVVQYFNYAVFSLSAIALSESLMPGDTDEQKLTNFFASIILTVLARPIGSLIFGYIGDYFGRKPSIIIAGIISSIAAISASQIPDFNQIGILASIFLILSRMIFLTGLAGEIDGIRLYIAESVSQKKQNFSNGIITLVTQSGAMLASFLITYDQYDINGWRYCFLAGGMLGIISSISRIFITESIEFQHSKDHPSKYYKPTFSQIINGQFFNLIYIIIIFGSIGTLYQFNIIFLPSFLGLKLDNEFKNIIPLIIFSYALMAPIWGMIADKIGGYKTLHISVTMILFCYLGIYICIKNNQLIYLKYLLILITSISSGFSITSHILLKKNLNIGIRYRLFSIGHSLGSLILSTPTAYAASIIATNYKLHYAISYPAALVLAGLICIRLIAKEFR